MTDSLYLRAFKPDGSSDALPDGLTTEELAVLRASSLDGVDVEKSDRLRRRMTNLIQREDLQLSTVTEEVWTGSYLVTRRQPRDFRREGPDDVRPLETCVVDAEQGLRLERMSKDDRQAHGITSVQRQMELRKKLVVSQEVAKELYGLDSADWGDGSRMWAKIEQSAYEPRPEHPAISTIESRKIRFTPKKVLLKNFGPYCDTLGSLMANASKNWLHEYRNPDGKGWDEDGLKLELKRRELWNDSPKSTAGGKDVQDAWFPPRGMGAVG